MLNPVKPASSGPAEILIIINNIIELAKGVTLFETKNKPTITGTRNTKIKPSDLSW